MNASSSSNDHLPRGHLLSGDYRVVFGGAVIKEVNLLLILAGILLGPFLLNWRAVKANLRGLKVDRNLPLRISAGDVLSVDLNLTNTRKKLGSWAVVVQKQIQRKPPTDATIIAASRRCGPACCSLTPPLGNRAKASTVAGWSSAAATAWGRCGLPRDSLLDCSPARSPSASLKRSSCCRAWAG